MVQKWLSLFTLFTTKSSAISASPVPWIDDYNIHQTDAMKFLGVTSESTLTWRKYIDYINSKLNSLGYMFRSLRNTLSFETVKQIYFAYIYSGLNYGVIFWGNSPHSRAILITQKRFIRIIMKANTRISCRMLFRKI